MNHRTRVEFLTKMLIGHGVPKVTVEEIAERWGQDCSNVYEDGYDQAASLIALKLQKLAPTQLRTIADARVAGAWADAAKVAVNHLGKWEKEENRNGEA